MIARLVGLLTHKLARNVGWLLLIQASTYLSYLIVIPWLTRALPVAEYGAVVAVMAAAQFGFIVTDYGFSASATYEVSCHREERTRLQRIIAEVHGAKLWLVLLTLAGLWALSGTGTYRDHGALFAWAGLAILLQAYQPIWLLQGLEDMRAYALYMVAARLGFMVAVYALVRAPGQGAYVLAAFALSNGLGTVLGLRAVQQRGLRVGALSLFGGLRLMRASSGYFWGRLAFAVYSSLNSVVLGAVALRQAGLFNVAEQVYKAGQSVGGPVSQAMLPALAHSRDPRVLWKILPALVGITVLGCALVALFAPELIRLVFGPGYAQALPVLYVFLVSIPVTIAGMVLGFPWFAAMGVPDAVNQTSVWAAGLHVVLLASLWWLDALSAYNVALCVLATESFMLLFRIVLGCALARSRRCG